MYEYYVIYNKRLYLNSDLVLSQGQSNILSLPVTFVKTLNLSE